MLHQWDAQCTKSTDALLCIPIVAQMTDLEAGWGFVPEERSLLIFTSILPCTVALEYDDSVPDGVTLRNRHCYDEAAAKIEAYTGAQTDTSQDAAPQLCQSPACRLRWASCSMQACSSASTGVLPAE